MVGFNPRVTREFLETGRTENQRLHTSEQVSQISGAATRFAAEFLERNPDAEAFATNVRAQREGVPPAPGPQDASDLSDDELRTLTHRLIENPNTNLSVADGAELSKLIANF